MFYDKNFIKHVLNTFKCRKIQDNFCYNDKDIIEKLLKDIKNSILNTELYIGQGFMILSKSDIFDEVDYITYYKHMTDELGNNIYMYITGLLDSAIVSCSGGCNIEYEDKNYFCYWYLYLALVKEKVYRTLKVNVWDNEEYSFWITLYDETITGLQFCN